MRYIILLLLNLPVVSLAVLNTVMQYKLKKIDKPRFRRQITFWLIIIVTISASFPVYNVLTDQPIFKSDLFSWFDIAQTTAIVYLIYFITRQSQHLASIEKTARELHQELSIKLSKK